MDDNVNLKNLCKFEMPGFIGQRHRKHRTLASTLVLALVLTLVLTFVLTLVLTLVLMLLLTLVSTLALTGSKRSLARLVPGGTEQCRARRWVNHAHTPLDSMP